MILSGTMYRSLVRSTFHLFISLAKDFIRKLLVIDPKARLTAAQALAHPWLATNQNWEKEIYSNIKEPDQTLKTCISRIIASCNSHRKVSLMKSLMKIIPHSQWTSLVPIAELNEEDLSNYLNGLSSNSVRVVRKKILFVGKHCLGCRDSQGDQRIGKTSLMKCFLNENRSKKVEPGRNQVFAISFQ